MPLELAPGLRGALAVLVVVLLLVPVRVGEAQGVDISIGFATFLLAVPFIVLLPRTFAGWHLILAFLASAAALLAGLVVAGSASIRPVFGFAYFWLPFLLFPVGWWLIRSQQELSRVVRQSALVSAAVGIGIAVTLLATGTPVRTEGTLMGSLAGLPLYATFGVNSLATIYAMQWCLILVDLLVGRGLTWVGVLFRLAGLCSLTYLLVFSLSRGSVGGCLAFALSLLVFMLRYRTRTGIVLLAGMLMVSTVVMVKYGDLISFAWSAKLDAGQAREDFGAADQATAGRYTLYLSALQDLKTRPIIGSAFAGFLSHPGETRQVGDEVNASPHNQYLMVLWKMGLVAGAVYLSLLFRIIWKGLRGLRLRESHVAAGLLLMLLSLMATSLMVWDALLVPNIGALFLFYLGGLAAVAESRTRPAGAGRPT